VVRLFSYYEKVILAFLAVVIVVSGTYWYRQFTVGRDGSPNVGGSYVEGIVGDEQEMRQIALRLTKVGFFRFDTDGRLQNVLVKDWQVNPEKTSYTFTLNDKIDRNEIITDLENNIDLFGSATVDQNEVGQVLIASSEPNSSLPLILTQPLFDYGPYKISKATDQTTIFSRNPKEGAQLPYLNKIIIHSYESTEELQQALTKKKLDGAEVVDGAIPNGYSLKSYAMERYFAVVFNLNKSPFREVALRQAIVDDQAIPATPFTLTVADQEPNKTLATEIVQQWKARGAQVSLELKPTDEIQDKVGPSRTFQALLIGIDYGTELDPTYLWSSTQIRPPGNNLSGIKSATVDAQIDALKATLNASERLNMIDGLHGQLQKEYAAVFVRQEKINFVVKDSHEIPTPWLARTIADRYRSIADWYVK
jgi:ABC-type transport system substrate-binding protein